MFHSTLYGMERIGVSSIVLRVYPDEVFGCQTRVYVLAKLLSCDVGCVPYFHVVYGVVYLYFVVVDFEYF